MSMNAALPRQIASRAGLRLDQAPPLSIPLRFFLSAPLFMLAGAALLIGSPGDPALSRYLFPTIALTHLTTLGVLSMVMFGALYQLTPVVAASPVPRIGTARLVHATLCVGTLGLASGLLLHQRHLLYPAIGALGLAWFAFIVPVGLALWRSPAGTEATVKGMRLAVLCLGLVGALGLWIAHGHAGLPFPGPRPLWMGVHLGLGLLGWVGSLITAVSFQVLPMFYLTPPLSAAHQKTLLVAIACSVVLAVLGLTASALLPAQPAASVARVLSYAWLPAAASVWVAMPLLTLRAIARRQRKRADASLRFWKAGLGCALLCAGLSVAAVSREDPRTELLLGWFAIFGWALLIMHGMLYRIVPFLVWFHRLSHLVGIVPVPSVGKLLPEAWPALAFGLHLGVLAAGGCGIWLRSGLLVRITGCLLAALALQLFRALLHLARYRAPTLAGASQN